MCVAFVLLLKAYRLMSRCGDYVAFLLLQLYMDADEVAGCGCCATCCTRWNDCIDIDRCIKCCVFVRPFSDDTLSPRPRPPRWRGVENGCVCFGSPFWGRT